MSTKPETTFYTSVHRHLPKTGLNPYREKMYNPLRGGTPDFWYSGKKDLWVEYKFVVLPKRDDTLIKIDTSALQTAWLTERYEEGRNVSVIIGCREGGVLSTDPREWGDSVTTAEFKSRLISRKDIAGWLVRRTMGI